MKLEFDISKSVGNKLLRELLDIQIQLNETKYKNSDNEASESEAFSLWVKSHIPNIRWCSTCGIENCRVGTITYSSKEDGCFITLFYGKYFCQNCAQKLVDDNDINLILDGTQLNLTCGVWNIKKKEYTNVDLFT